LSAPTATTVCRGSASKNANLVLERLEIAGRFDAVVTGHDFAHSTELLERKPRTG